MESFASKRPAPALAPFIESYAGYRMLGEPPGVHRGLPSKFVTFIFGIGEGIDVIRQTDPRQSPGRYRSVLSGLQASPAMISHSGNQEGVAVELTPAGFHALFGMPARELWNLTVDPGELDTAGDELWQRLQTEHTWEGRFDACDRVLTRMLREDQVRRELRNAWWMLVETGGRMPVEELAYRVGWSRHNLTRRFREEFGLGPKLAARIIRFQKAQKLLSAGGEIADVASTCGYFDQAHMNRDFVRFAELPPARLMAERASEQVVPSFQD